MEMEPSAGSGQGKQDTNRSPEVNEAGAGRAKTKYDQRPRGNEMELDVGSGQCKEVISTEALM